MLLVWCRDTLNPFAEIDMLGGPINCIALHPERQILVAAGCHGRITMYDLKTLETLQTFRSESRATVACVGFYVSRSYGKSCLDLAQPAFSCIGGLAGLGRHPSPDCSNGYGQDHARAVCEHRINSLLYDHAWRGKGYHGFIQ